MSYDKYYGRIGNEKGWGKGYIYGALFVEKGGVV